MFRLLLLLLLSCSNLDDINYNSSIEWVESLSINRSSSELYIQVELSETINSDAIDSVSINLEYIGDLSLEYNKTLMLYDNGDIDNSGDIVANNGVYTLVAHPDSLLMPEDPVSIHSISFPTSKQLNQSEPDTIEFSVRTNGNLYGAGVNIFINNEIHVY